MLPTKHTKEGVLNEKLALKKLLTYITSVYKIPQKIKCLSDKRKRKSIPLFNIVMPVLLFLMLQYESFHTVFSAPESMSKRLRNCINGKIPKIDAVRDLLSGIDPEEVRKIHEETIDTLKRTACDPGTGNAEAEGNFVRIGVKKSNSCEQNVRGTYFL